MAAPDSAAPPSLAGLVYDDPREADAAAFPADASPAAQLAFMLNWAVRAPSVLNTQPWFFVVEGRLARLHADRSRQLRTLDSDGRSLAISCGAALFFLDVAARHFGYATEAYLQPCAEHPDVLGTLLLAHEGGPTPEDERLFRVLDAGTDGRCTLSDDVPPSVTDGQLAAVVGAEGARLHVLVEREPKEALANLIALGVAAQASDPHLSGELRDWVRACEDTRPDGVPERISSLWDRPATLRFPPSRLAEHRRELATDAPALLVLATETDDAIAWMRAGRALGHLLLTGGSALRLAYASEPIEVGMLREEVGQLVGAPYPQLVLGVCAVGRHALAPRRPVRDVLLRSKRQAWSWAMV